MDTPRRNSQLRSFSIDVRRDDRRIDLGVREIRAAVRKILDVEGVRRAELSVAIVDDATIHEVNRDHLGHDHPTDVISFVYESAQVAEKKNASVRGQGLAIEGEIIVSAETAVREAARHGWSARAELLLYIAHGLLHLCGYDDLTPGEKRIMRRRERAILAALGVR